MVDGNDETQKTCMKASLMFAYKCATGVAIGFSRTLQVKAEDIRVYDNLLGFVAAPAGNKKKTKGVYSNVVVKAELSELSDCPSDHSGRPGSYCFNDVAKTGVSIPTIYRSPQNANPGHKDQTPFHSADADAAIYGKHEFNYFKFYGFTMYTAASNYKYKLKAIDVSMSPDFIAPSYWKGTYFIDCD